MRDRPAWLPWVIGLVIVALIVAIGVHAAIGAVQDPYLTQAKVTNGNTTDYALVIVQRDPSSQDIAKVIQVFAANHTKGPFTAEFYTDGNAAVSFESGGPADTASTQQAHVGELTRNANGAAQGWANAKGSAGPGKVTIQVS